MPCFVLFQIFIVIPLVEFAILYYIGESIGLGPTIGLVIVTGAVGLVLARWQGTRVFRNMQEDMKRGQVPAPHLMDGVMILLAGAVLMTPGLLTAIFGFLLLLPPFRKIIKGMFRRWIERSVKRGTMRVHFNVGGVRYRDATGGTEEQPRTPGSPKKPLLDADCREVDD